VCAAACCALEREDEAKQYLLDSMKSDLPHGFITPFAESIYYLGGLLERLLEQEFPAFYGVVIEQWKCTFSNWLTFHNRFAKDNITLILTLREYQIAQLASQRVPRAKIAKQFNISAGRLNNIMEIIYGKLFISNRTELSNLIL
jgi:DNA-binding CsgD family transcriptional regulator